MSPGPPLLDHERLLAPLYRQLAHLQPTFVVGEDHYTRRF
jgi:hypothetical protein